MYCRDLFRILLFYWILLCFFATEFSIHFLLPAESDEEAEQEDDDDDIQTLMKKYANLADVEGGEESDPGSGTL